MYQDWEEAFVKQRMKNSLIRLEETFYSVLCTVNKVELYALLYWDFTVDVVN